MLAGLAEQQRKPLLSAGSSASRPLRTGSGMAGNDGVRIGIEVACLIGITAAVLLVYGIRHPALYTPATDLDPWYYTSFWTNFVQMYHLFSFTYYATRLSIIAPQYVLSLLGGAKFGYLAFHGLTFFGAAFSLYFAVRTLFGVVPGIAVFSLMLGLESIATAFTYDYFDGPAIFYVALTLFFLTRRRGNRVQYVCLLAAGASAVAGTIANLFTLVVVAPLALVYAFSLPGREKVALSRIAADMTTVVVGGLISLAFFQLFSTLEHGTESFFLKPQLAAVVGVHESSWKLPYDTWVPNEPYIVAPILILIMLAVLCVFRFRRRELPSAALGVLIYLLVVCGFWTLDELVFGGYFAEYLYYFNLLMPGIALGVGACVRLLLSNARQSVGPALGVAGAVVGCLVLVRFHSSESLIGASAYPIVAVVAALLGVLLVAALCAGASPARFRPLVLGVSLMMGASVAYPIDGSVAVQGRLHPATGTGQSLLTLATQIEPYLRRFTGNRGVPMFWYRATQATSWYGGLQSFYLYDYTALPRDMPSTAGLLRSYEALASSNWEAKDPAVVVLLCARRSCDGGQVALELAGINADRASERFFHAGPLALWLDVLEVHAPARQP